MSACRSCITTYCSIVLYLFLFRIIAAVNYFVFHLKYGYPSRSCSLELCLLSRFYSFSHLEPHDTLCTSSSSPAGTAIAHSGVWHNQTLSSYVLDNDPTPGFSEPTDDEQLQAAIALSLQSEDNS